MPSDVEIVCPFCHARSPLTGTTDRPYPFGRSGDFNVHHCPCGAVGVPPTIFDPPDWTLHMRKTALCQGLLGAEPDDCEVDMNSVMLTNHPMEILWVKRRASPSA